MALRTLDTLDLAGRKVLVRVDLNVPVEAGRVTDDTRIRAAVPTVRAVLEAGGVPLLLSHFGRPRGQAVPSMSLEPLAQPVAAALGAPVVFCPSCIGPRVAAAVEECPPGGAVLLENTRFHPGEEKNDPDFVAALAENGDAYVNDAFSAAHRAHASTEGLAHILPSAAGLKMQAELEALAKALEAPARPVVAVVGGAKVSSKLDLLGNLVGRVDRIVIGGGMANTFLAAKGVGVGQSLCEHDLADTAREIMGRAEAAGCSIELPVDVVAAEAFAADAPHVTVAAEDCPAEAMILDAGPQTVARLKDLLSEARTVVWNGPLGAFEIRPFDAATVAVAAHVAAMTAEGRCLSVAGGGDTVAALNAAGATGGFSYVSTAGGAFLEWLEGRTLPGVAALGG